jgi:hypothetical protein
MILRLKTLTLSQRLIPTSSNKYTTPLYTPNIASESQDTTKEQAPAVGSNSTTAESQGMQALEMLLAERRRMEELERQALERYKTLKEQNIEREQQAFEVFLKASKAKASLDNEVQAAPSSQSSSPNMLLTRNKCQ